MKQTEDNAPLEAIDIAESEQFAEELSDSDGESTVPCGIQGRNCHRKKIPIRNFVTRKFDLLITTLITIFKNLIQKPFHPNAQK